MNYKITNQRAFIADIHEVKTNQTIKCAIEVGEAKKMLRHLNFGGGFDGWTPDFFMVSIQQAGE